MYRGWTQTPEIVQVWAGGESARVVSSHPTPPPFKVASAFAAPRPPPAPRVVMQQGDCRRRYHGAGEGGE